MLPALHTLQQYLTGEKCALTPNKSRVVFHFKSLLSTWPWMFISLTVDNDSFSCFAVSRWLSTWKVNIEFLSRNPRMITVKLCYHSIVLRDIFVYFISTKTRSLNFTFEQYFKMCYLVFIDNMFSKVWFFSVKIHLKWKMKSELLLEKSSKARVTVCLETQSSLFFI